MKCEDCLFTLKLEMLRWKFWRALRKSARLRQLPYVSFMFSFYVFSCLDSTGRDGITMMKVNNTFKKLANTCPHRYTVLLTVV